MADTPIPLAHVGRKLLDLAVGRHNATPERWEIRLGLGVIEELGSDLRRLTSLTHMWDLPVSFPEEPGRRPNVIDVLLVCDFVAVDAGLDVSMLWRADL